jgi:hypothetical protein
MEKKSMVVQVAIKKEAKTMKKVKVTIIIPEKLDTKIRKLYVKKQGDISKFYIDAAKIKLAMNGTFNNHLPEPDMTIYTEDWRPQKTEKDNKK